MRKLRLDRVLLVATWMVNSKASVGLLASLLPETVLSLPPWASPHCLLPVYMGRDGSSSCHWALTWQLLQMYLLKWIDFTLEERKKMIPLTPALTSKVENDWHYSILVNRWKQNKNSFSSLLRRVLIINTHTLKVSIGIQMCMPWHAIPLLEISSKEIINIKCKDMHTSLFITASFVVVKTYRQLKCSLTGKWINILRNDVWWSIM